MSRTRYYPVSQSFLNDAETWEMRDQFGDRSVFMWMSLLSAAEMDEGNIHGTPAYIARIHGQYLDRTHPERAQNLLVYLTTKRWLTPLLKDGLTVGYFITNYWKYHKRPNLKRDANSGQFAPVPNLSEPSEPIIKDTDTSKSATKPELSIQDFCDSWNEYFKGKLPAIRLPLAISRERKLRARLRDHPELQFWKDVFGKVWNSDFLMGRNGNSNGNWKASFDWLIANDTNVLKIAEGNYVNKDR